MQRVYKFVCFCVFAVTLLSTNAFAKDVSDLQDMVVFGQAESEQAHNFSSMGSRVIEGGLDQPARQLLPKEPAEIYGNSMSFTVKCDPNKPNYFTIKLWGSDAGEELGRLVLFCEGDQVGWNHLGFVDPLNIASDDPYFNERFFYKTLPLPKKTTKGKDKLQVKIRPMGRIWGYGGNVEQYYKKLEKPSRGIYRIYVHTNGYFAPSEEERQGKAPVDPPARKKPGVEILDKLKERVNREINGLLRKDKLNQMQLQFLAKAYYENWTDAYKNEDVVEKCLEGLDNYYRRWRKNPDLAKSDPATYNPGWFGFGPAGDTIRLLAEEFEAELDEKINDGQGNTVKRRKAWSDMLVASRKWHRRHRRQYTNQSMIVDLNIYATNAGIRAIDPDSAAGEEEIVRYLYESVGLKPWLGSEGRDGKPTKPLGDDYWQLTQAGLTKELGYVGSYGEVLDWVKKIYDVTRMPSEEGNKKIKQRLEKMMNARAVFRYSMLDPKGNRAMRLETVVGWRDDHYPGKITYIERMGWDCSPLGTAATVMSKRAIGYAQQMFEDNQYFNAVKNHMENGGFRVTSSLLPVPRQYEKLKYQPESKYRLPMTDGQPDFVWSDEEDGVLAVKNGDERLYASLYWRAKYGINNLARVHYITPIIDRIAVVRQDTEFDPSGKYFTVGNSIDKGFRWGDIDPPGRDWDQAFAGMKQPIAKVPEGMEQPDAGQENPYVGRGNFYRCRYGKYLIGMNCTEDESYTLDVPESIKQAKNLSGGDAVEAGQSIEVSPMSTVVIYITD